MENTHLSASTHPATNGCRLSSILWVSALAVLPSGCGLSDYQKQMAKEQQRIERLEEEDAKLGDPVQLPDKKDRPAAYFFRPPKPVAFVGVPVESSVFTRFGIGQNTVSYFQDVAVAIEGGKEDDFWAAVLRLVPNVKRTDATDATIAGPGGNLVLKELKSEGGSLFAYVWSRGDVHAGVVFRLTRANDETARKLMEMSLGTLTVGADAARMHRAFQERTKQKADAARRKEAAARGDR